MSTLSTTHEFSPVAAEPAAEPARKPFWRRVYERVVSIQQRRAEREIAAYLASRGGLLNDEAEREISLYLNSGGRP
jgi:hypothetical protein